MAIVTLTLAPTPEHAARYFHECLPKSEYWDVPVAAQTEEATAPRLIEFLQRTAA